MGRTLADRQIVRKQLGDKEGDFWIDIKTELSYGEKKALRKQFIRFDLDGSVKAIDRELEEANTILIELAVVDWNVVDEKGEKLLVNRELINSMRDKDVVAILLALN